MLAAFSLFAVLQTTAPPAAAVPDALVRGEVQLSCEAQGDGRLTGCRVAREAPAGQGMGQAALNAADSVRVKAAPQGGPAKGSRVAVPVRLEFTRLEAALNGIRAPGVPERILTSASWRKRPDGQMLARHYPIRAYEKGVGGRVRVVCEIGGGGGMSVCEVLEESPTGYGFGSATKALAIEGFKMDALDVEGKSTAGRVVVIPIVWQVAPD